MRTTIELPDRLHHIASGLAQQNGRSLSQTVADLMERGLGSAGSARTGTQFARLGTPRGDRAARRSVSATDQRERRQGAERRSLIGAAAAKTAVLLDGG